MLSAATKRCSGPDRDIRVQPGEDEPVSFFDGDLHPAGRADHQCRRGCPLRGQPDLIVGCAPFLDERHRYLNAATPARAFRRRESLGLPSSVVVHVRLERSVGPDRGPPHRVARRPRPSAGRRHRDKRRLWSPIRSRTRRPPRYGSAGKAASGAPARIRRRPTTPERRRAPHRTPRPDLSSCGAACPRTAARIGVATYFPMFSNPQAIALAEMVVAAKGAVNASTCPRRAFRLLDAVRAEQRLSAWSRTSSPGAAAADFGGNVPICAILRHALSERCPHRGTKGHTGVSWHPVDSGGIGPATRFDARGLDLSAGECLSRGQSSTSVLPGSMGLYE